MQAEQKTIPAIFEEIYLSYCFRMRCFAQEYVLYEADAENIVQDVFTELWAKREVLSCPINIVAFLFTAVKNRCIDHLRHKIIVREAETLLQEEYQLTMNAKLASLELFDQTLFAEESIELIVSKALDALPDRCREIFIKSRMEGKKQKEIAAEMNISLKTVENQMNIAYRKLREELKDYLPLQLYLLTLWS